MPGVPLLRLLTFGLTISLALETAAQIPAAQPRTLAAPEVGTQVFNPGGGLGLFGGALLDFSRFVAVEALAGVTINGGGFLKIDAGAYFRPGLVFVGLRRDLYRVGLLVAPVFYLHSAWDDNFILHAELVLWSKLHPARHETLVLAVGPAWLLSKSRRRCRSASFLGGCDEEETLKQGKLLPTLRLAVAW
jgi:hypothetical protein